MAISAIIRGSLFIFAAVPVFIIRTILVVSAPSIILVVRATLVVTTAVPIIVISVFAASATVLTCRFGSRFFILFCQIIEIFLFHDL